MSSEHGSAMQAYSSKRFAGIPTSHPKFGISLSMIWRTRRGLEIEDEDEGKCARAQERERSEDQKEG